MGKLNQAELISNANAKDGAIDGLSMLASSVAGRDLHVYRLDTHWAWTDGSTIYLPLVCSNSNEITVIAQALLITGGSFHKPLMRRLMTVSERTKQRFIAQELVRITKALEYRLPRVFCQKVLTLDITDASFDRDDSLRRAVGLKSCPVADNFVYGTIRPAKFLMGSPVVGGSELTDKEIESAFNRNIKNDDDKDEKKDSSLFLKNMSLSIFSQNSMSKMLRDIFGMSSTNSNDGEEKNSGRGADLDMAGAKLATKLNSGAKIVAKAFGLDFDSFQVASGTKYHEWNVNSSRYYESWCCVHHFDEDAPKTNEIRRDFPDTLLRKKIAKLNTDYRRHRRQREGEDIDNDAIIEYVVDRAAGVLSGEQQVFQQAKKTGRNLGVTLLIDASESTNDKLECGSTIWSKQRELAFNLVSALDEMGDSVAAYGFRSFGRNDVRFLTIKSFSQRFDLAAINRLHSIKPGGFTRLGAAIRHASHIVSSTAGTDNQLIVVISDGIPFDMQYEKDYAQADVRKALEESENNGVGCVCLSVGSSVDAEVIEKAWGNVGHASFNSPRELGLSIDKLFYSAILRAASGGIVQRKVRRMVA